MREAKPLPFMSVRPPSVQDRVVPRLRHTLQNPPSCSAAHLEGTIELGMALMQRAPIEDVARLHLQLASPLLVTMQHCDQYTDDAAVMTAACSFLR